MDTVSGAVFDLKKGMKTVLGFPRHSITMENWTFLGSNESLPFLSPQHSVNSKKNTRLEKGALACLLLYKGSNTIMTCLDKGDYLWNTHTHTSFRSYHHKLQLWTCQETFPVPNLILSCLVSLDKWVVFVPQGLSEEMLIYPTCHQMFPVRAACKVTR